MKFKISTILLITLMMSCSDKPTTYPETKKNGVVDDYFGTQVPDPYRWLEDDNSKETAAWVNNQNKSTQTYLDSIPYRKDIEKRLQKMWDYKKISAPFKEGDFEYFFKNEGLQNQSIMYRKSTNGNVEVFLDPNTFSADGTTSLANFSFSKDGSLLAYAISEGGSDWRKIIVKTTADNKVVGDTLVDVKFSGISWYKNQGFYYSSYDKPVGSELSSKTDQHKVYYHKLNTPQSNDVLVFGNTPAEKHRYVGAQVSEDARFLFISASNSTSGNKLYIKNLSNPNSKLECILNHEKSDTYAITNTDDKLYLVTNLNAPNKKIITVNAHKPQPENWVDFIPESDHVLTVSKGGGYFFAEYMVHAVSKVEQYDYDGKLIRAINLPGIGSVSGFNGKVNDKMLFYSFSNYKTPSTIFKYNVKTGESVVYIKPEVDFNSDAYQSKQVFYASSDGTKIPMIITYKKGLQLNGKNPTILYGYGGFNVSLTPSFNPSNAVWLEQGGIYAVPNIRGGGEYGKDWHNAGIKLKKQNVFDDFIAAAEYLINKNYTSSNYLAIKGGSNGGLLVGATMTQRPDLAKVALPAVGVLDMLRYHKFTSGAGWAYDYGTAQDDKTMFKYLMSYSPLHNVKNGVTYPATLITTGDHDDRVVPAHSFKFAAELQNKQEGTNPVLIRIETNAGHGAGTPISKTIAQAADVYGFTLYNMGYKVLPSTINSKLKD